MPTHRSGQAPGQKRTRPPRRPIDITTVTCEPPGDTYLDDARYTSAVAVLRRATGKYRSSAAADDFPLLEGRTHTYPVRGDKIVVGRAGKGREGRADVDLCAEGPCRAIARRQALISRSATGGRYTLQNTGRRVMYVDGKMLTEGDCTTLAPNSIIEMAHIRLVFRCK